MKALCVPVLNMNLDDWINLYPKTAVLGMVDGA